MVHTSSHKNQKFFGSSDPVPLETGSLISSTIFLLGGGWGGGGGWGVGGVGVEGVGGGKKTPCLLLHFDFCELPGLGDEYCGVT